jgi:hypothetical protein
MGLVASIMAARGYKFFQGEEQAPKAFGHVCEYACQGCEGAKNGIVFYEFCARDGKTINGLDCPVKLGRNGEERKENEELN